MSYVLKKKSLDTSVVSSLFEINTDYRIDDIYFAKGFGFVLLMPTHHCIGLIDNDGQIHIPWIGQVDNPGTEEGFKERALLNLPSSICCDNTLQYCFLVEQNGKNIRKIEMGQGYIGSFLGKTLEKQIGKYFPKNNKECSLTSCCIDSSGNIYWLNGNLNRCFSFAAGVFSVFTGNGKSDYSVSSNLQYCSLNHPSSIMFNKGKFFIADTDNHCVREINKNKMSLVSGSPNKDSIIKSPTKMRIRNDIIYFIDGSKVKYYSMSNKKTEDIYESSKTVSIEIDDKSLILLETI